MGKELRSKEYLATEEFLKSQGVPTLGYIQPPGKMEGGDVLWIDERHRGLGWAAGPTRRASVNSRN